MVNDDEAYTEILTGEAADGLHWRVLAHEVNATNFMTVVERWSSNTRPARSGFGGPKLPVDGVINYWHGQSAGTPPFILVRTDPSIEKVTIVGQDNSIIDVPLSGLIAQYGLRFGAAPLPYGYSVSEVKARTENLVEHIAGQIRRPATTSGDGSEGWAPEG